MKTVALLLMLCSPAWASVRFVTGDSYDARYSHDRTYGVWLDASRPMNDTGEPIIVYVHGGAWSGGSQFRHATGLCRGNEVDSLPCRAAEEGYAVYVVDYRLT